MVDFFCQTTGIELIVRAHQVITLNIVADQFQQSSVRVQVVENGYEFFAHNQLLTIFTAPNYCSFFDNDSGVLHIGEDLKCEIQVILTTKFPLSQLGLNLHFRFWVWKPSHLKNQSYWKHLRAELWAAEKLWENFCMTLLHFRGHCNGHFFTWQLKKTFFKMSARTRNFKSDFHCSSVSGDSETNSSLSTSQINWPLVELIRMAQWRVPATYKNKRELDRGLGNETSLRNKISPID